MTSDSENDDDLSMREALVIAWALVAALVLMVGTLLWLI